MMLKPHELHAALGILIHRIEACGGSPELTAAVMLASDIRQSVGNRWNPANEYAAQRVRDTFGTVDPADPVVPPASAWRDPKTDPPTSTGKILIWVEGVGPAIVNVEERWMCYWNGNDESEPTAPHEWDWWCEIPAPSES